MAAPTTGSDDLLTIDQLAERTGVSVRTIRFYSGKGLLPAPRLRGRTGLYDTTHRARLQLIGELTALGFTLAAIERQLDRVPHDAGPEELALQLALLTPWAVEPAETPEDVDRSELAQRCGRSPSEQDLDGLRTLGVLAPLDDGRYRLHRPSALPTALETLSSDLPPELWRRAHEVIERHTTDLANELMALFQDEVLQPYRDRGRPADERSRLAEALSRLKPVTVQGVVTAFGRAVNRTIRERLGG